MKSRELLQKTLNHEPTERIVLDLGSSPTTGIHVLAVEKLREYYGLEKKPVRVIEPYQMLGLVEEDLIEAIGIDIIGAWGPDTMFGYPNRPPLKEFKTFWGQTVLVPELFSSDTDEKGNLLTYPEGDVSVGPSAKMPPDRKSVV